MADLRFDKSQYPALVAGISIGFFLAALFPGFTFLLRAFLIQTCNVILVVLLWALLFIGVAVAYKVFVDKDPEFVKLAAQDVVDRISSFTNRSRIAAVTGDAARPYPKRDHSAATTTRSISPSRSTVVEEQEKPEKKPAKKSSDAESFAFRPYEQPKVPRTRSESKTTLLSKSPNVTTPTTRDPNRIGLVGAYVRIDASEDSWTAIKGRSLSLKITNAGLLLDDEGGMNGILTADMISLIEHDVTKHSVMRATTGSEPFLQVLYLIQDDERWKVALGIHSMKRELKIRTKEVDGERLLEFTKRL